MLLSCITSCSWRVLLWGPRGSFSLDKTGADALTSNQHISRSASFVPNFSIEAAATVIVQEIFYKMNAEGYVRV